MSRGRLARLPGTTWAELASAGLDSWVYLDTDRPGLHVVQQLGARPAQVSHVWGWAGGVSGALTMLRARVDRDLPGGGIAGACLRVGDGLGDEDGEVVDCDPGPAVGWGRDDGLVAADFTQGLVSLQPYTVWRVRRTSTRGGVAESSVLQFLSDRTSTEVTP